MGDTHSLLHQKALHSMQTKIRLSPNRRVYLPYSQGLCKQLPPYPSSYTELKGIAAESKNGWIGLIVSVVECDDNLTSTQCKVQSEILKLTCENATERYSSSTGMRCGSW